MDTAILHQYFPDLTDHQKERFNALGELYKEWNARINVISRKDIDNLYERHILHSLSIAKLVQFKPGKQILDVGTGGGFPGVPLAIMFPETEFWLVDSINKKLNVVDAVTEELGMDNVTTQHIRVEQLTDRYDFVVTRAVAKMPVLVDWVNGKLKRHSKHELKNGILALKGGDLTEELQPFGKKATVYPIQKFFPEEFFNEKAVVYLQMVND